MPRRFLLALIGVTAGLLLIAVSLAPASPQEVEAQEEGAIEATVQAGINAWNSHDVGNFLGVFTEQGFQAAFGVSKSDVQQVGEIIGDPPILDFSVENIVVEDSTATAEVVLSFGDFSQSELWTFIYTGTRWQIDNTASVAPEIPAGVTVVDVQLDEYEFTYDQTAIASGGNIAFAIENIGEEAHELVLFRITTDAPFTDLLQSEEEEPEGIEFLAAGEVDPGESSAVVLSEPLGAGRYGIVCFFPSPDGTPHAFLGMVSEFNVGGAGPITPPSTGSGGLAGSASEEWPPAAFVLGAVLMMVGLLSLVPASRR
jgi:uncharacterized cupredoxin-like copper-binding protein